MKDETLEAAYLAGFNASGEGYNGEYGIDCPEENAIWKKDRDKAITAIKQARALDKMAENARELGLDYEPAPVQDRVRGLECVIADLQAELDATNRQVEILSDALAESRREVAALKAVQEPSNYNEFVETACALIKAADDAAADRDYMLDSDDCIAVLRGTWKAPLANDMPQTLAAQPAPVQPAAWESEMRSALAKLGFEGQCPESIGITIKGWFDAYAKSLTAQRAPLQEPFEYWNAVEGWVKIDEVREHFDSVGCGTIYKTAGDGRVPLTASQRTWVGLTDDEILKLAYPIRWQEVDDFEADKAVNFAQAIEAKLKEKNT
jgi:hypothetical protein